MKRKTIIFISIISLFVSSCSQEGFWGSVRDEACEFAGGLLLGAADNMVRRTGDQETIDSWNNIKQTLGSNGTYGSHAGQQLGHGDYKGAAISAISSIAESAGVRSDIVALGNSGLNNFVNGDKNAAIIDITQMATHATGNENLDVLFDFHRDYNQINRQYRENIQNGMSESEARQIKNNQLAEEITDIWDYVEAYRREQQEMIKARKKEVKMALLARGYSDMEAEYLSTSLSIEDIENDDTQWASVDEILDYHNINYRESSDENVFFDDITNNADQNNTRETAPNKKPSVSPEPTPVEQPVDPSAEAKNRITKIAPNRYLLNHVGLNENQKEALDEVASLMNQYPNIRICLNGNTCDLGTEQINSMIATKRANNAKEYLVNKGIDASRITIESKAYAEPIMEGHTAEARLQNRRVSITILED